MKFNFLSGPLLLNIELKNLRSNQNVDDRNKYFIIRTWKTEIF